MNATRRCGTAAGAGIVGLGMVAMAMIALSLPGPASAQETITLSECLDAWNDSPASSVCEVDRPNLNKDNTICSVIDISCTVTATLDDERSVTWTPNFSSAAQSLSDTRALDLCFKADSSATHGYSTALKAGCGSDETSAGNM